MERFSQEGGSVKVQDVENHGDDRDFTAEEKVWFAGIGKPEPLVGNLSGYWSRRIDDTHRLVYEADDVAVLIVACRFHYDR